MAKKAIKNSTLFFYIISAAGFILLSTIFKDIILDREFLFPAFVACMKEDRSIEFDPAYCKMINGELIELGLSYGIMLLLLQVVLWMLCKFFCFIAKKLKERQK